MLRRFDNHGQALAFGREFGEKNRCPVWATSAYPRGGKSVTFVAGPSSVHLLPKQDSHFSPIGGWWFGGEPLPMEQYDKVLSLQDRPPLPGNQEYFYSLAAGSTQGYTHEELVTIAANMEKNQTCVWHECAQLKNTTCYCGQCKKGK